MKYCLLVIALLLPFSVTANTNEQSYPLMPYPQEITAQDGKFLLPKKISISIEGIEEAQLNTMLTNFVKRTKLQTNIDFELTPSKNASSILQILVAHAVIENPNSIQAMDESYQLTISKKTIKLSAENSIGVNRGMETLLQLIGEQKKSVKLPLVAINDYPRFKWRGFLMDTSRHFFSITTIKRQLDAMAAAKLNVFHWHLTDDQGWRIELKSLPKLHQLTSGGEYYTQQDIRDVVAYAQARGIQVMPEVDMPGHASAIAVAYPELLSGPGPYASEIRWGVHSPTLNPANEQVYEFAEKIIGELTTLFPFEYIHMGGDEVNSDEWNKNPTIQTFMREKKLKSPQDLQAYFNQRLVKILAQHQRKMVGWDEIQHPDLPKDIIIQSWRGPDAVSDAVSHGFQALLSTGFYLDQAQTAAYHYRNDPLPPLPSQNDLIAEGEIAQSWSFSFARKRGGPVTGSFTLVSAKNNEQRGFIDFKDKSRRDLRSVKTINGLTTLSVDTWMGPLTISFPHAGKNSEKEFTGFARVANAAFELHGQLLANIPTGIKAPALTAQQHQLILGGEIALWAEILDESVIDTRLWPRGFAVAERLWSPANLHDEQNMYERLAVVGSVTQKSILLRQKITSENLLATLANSDNIEPLQIFSEALEQAQYYHRQHEKMTNATYSRTDRLDQFVDSLPPENLFSRQLRLRVDSWLQNPKDRAVKKELLATFARWHKNTAQASALINSRDDLKPLANLLLNVDAVAQLGTDLVQKNDRNKPLSQAEFLAAKQTIAAAQKIDNEMIISAAYSVEALLNAAQHDN
ncbi:MAG: N-acetyl-beta-hexosaminidase [Gammaproteobacteria bacterium]|nr:MAG: N-acetyl-beta-hexosaminidase [Gammaproteobacteria bacterium]